MKTTNWDSGALRFAVIFLLAAPGMATGRDCASVDPSPGTEIRAMLVTGGLSAPVDVAAPPQDTTRVFVVEQPGRIRLVHIPGDVLQAEPFLDIHEQVVYADETGLLGLAFHPRFADNGYFYVNYVRSGGPTGLETVLSRFEVLASNPDLADRGSEKVLLSFAQPFGNHKGGQVQFGPRDGFLYMSTGDGGGFADSGQDPASYLAKILRIDVDTGERYGIPPSNPFAGDDGILDEAWAFGLRNPWRFSIDSETGDMYIGDVGAASWEELDFVPGTSTGGENFQWRIKEGTHDGMSGDYGPGTPVGPILEYPHSDEGGFYGCVVVCGVVYRGCSMPELHGTYFFADFCFDWIASLRMVDGRVTELTDQSAALKTDLASGSMDETSAFGVDANGEIYVCDLVGRLYRIVSANPSSPLKRFTRGNVNGDSTIDISDAVHTLLYLFGGAQPAVPCLDAFDSNDDGQIGLSDAIYSLGALFSDGPAPPSPGYACGGDPTEDALTCQETACR